jgi:hypothetical protein
MLNPVTIQKFGPRDILSVSSLTERGNTAYSKLVKDKPLLKVNYHLGC